MSGSGRGRGGGAGRGSGNKRRAGRGGNSHGSKGSSFNSKGKTGDNKDLGTHVFDYGPRNAADIMTTTWEKIVIYTGSKFGEDISNELRTGTRIVPPKPIIPAASILWYKADVQRNEMKLQNLIDKKEESLLSLNSAIVGEQDAIKLALKLHKNKMTLSAISRELATAGHFARTSTPRHPRVVNLSTLRRVIDRAETELEL